MYFKSFICSLLVLYSYTVVVVVVVGAAVVVVVVVLLVVVVKLLFKSQSWQEIPSSCLLICHNKLSVVLQPIPLDGIAIL